MNRVLRKECTYKIVSLKHDVNPMLLQLSTHTRRAYSKPKKRVNGLEEYLGGIELGTQLAQLFVRLSIVCKERVLIGGILFGERMRKKRGVK